MRSEPCARKILSAVATRAYRRPLTEADTQVLLDFYRAGRAEEKTFDAGIQRGLERVLAAPSFIFRVNRPEAPELNLASKLSFFLWSSIPDDELLNTAIRGKLKDPAVLEQQVRRMLRDPRANALVEGFATRWLELSKIAGFVPDTQLYPEFDENLREAMAEETKLFVGDQLRQDRSVADLLLADYTFANDRLAQHYGIPNVYGSHYRPVKFNDRPPRRTARPGERAVGDVVSESDIGRDARTLAAGEHARRAAASAAARRAGAQGTRRGRAAEVAARADGSASQESGVRVVPSAHGPARLYAREFRCGRQVAQRGGWRARRSERVAAGRHAVRGRRRTADLSGRSQGRFRPERSAQASLVCHRSRHRVLRPARDSKDRARCGSKRLSMVVGDSRSGEQHSVQRACAEARREAPATASGGPREQ